jgi:hypothetical protein
VVLEQVVDRLENSLHHKIRMDLQRREEHQRVGRRDAPLTEELHPSDDLIKKTFQPINASSAPISAGEELSTAALLARDDIKGRLLILGEPGAGKTNELLALAKVLLQKAQQSKDKPIPVIFELSEWVTGQGKPLEDWLAEQLQTKYNVPSKVTQQWISENQLFPLLDGLDELRRVDNAENISLEDVDRQRQARQIQCIRTINAFLEKHPATPMVVCCRRKEYEALEAQGEYLRRLQGAIYLQELDDLKIKAYLAESKRGDLWETLKSQPALLEQIRSPLFLLMVVVAYQGQPIRSTAELLDLYIERQLQDLNNQGAYAPGKVPSIEKTHHYLCWLATKLEQQEVTEFLIERLQPSWLDRNHERTRYRIIVGLIFGLLGGLSGGLSGGLLAGLIFGLIFGLSEIKLAEKLSFSLRSLIAELRYGLIFGLIVGLIVGLIAELSGGLRVGLLGGLIGGLIVGLLLGLFSWLLLGLNTYEAEVEHKLVPNQGIRESQKTGLFVVLFSGLFVGLLVGLFVGLIFGLIFGLFSGLFFGLIGGLSGGLSGGLETVTQHGGLRIVLYNSGVAPWNYARFLTHAENHRFIQRVGGRYRFVHDLLRKRFAERYEPHWRN